MKDLLEAALESGAPMAPVLSSLEAISSKVFRDGFVEASGELNLPFIIRRNSK